MTTEQLRTIIDANTEETWYGDRIVIIRKYIDPSKEYLIDHHYDDTIAMVKLEDLAAAGISKEDAKKLRTLGFHSDFETGVYLVAAL